MKDKTKLKYKEIVNEQYVKVKRVIESTMDEINAQWLNDCKEKDERDKLTTVKGKKDKKSMAGTTIFSCSFSEWKSDFKT